MAQITLGGNPATTLGTLPENGTKAPDFNLTAADLSSKKFVILGSLLYDYRIREIQSKSQVVIFVLYKHLCKLDTQSSAHCCQRMRKSQKKLIFKFNYTKILQRQN